MKPKPNLRFTIVAFCTCGCDETEVHWIEARSKKLALRRLKKRLKPVAMFRGFRRDRLDPWDVE